MVRLELLLERPQALAQALLLVLVQARRRPVQGLEQPQAWERAQPQAL